MTPKIGKKFAHESLFQITNEALTNLCLLERIRNDFVKESHEWNAFNRIGNCYGIAFASAGAYHFRLSRRIGDSTLWYYVQKYVHTGKLPSYFSATRTSFCICSKRYGKSNGKSGVCIATSGPGQQISSRVWRMPWWIMLLWLPLPVKCFRILLVPMRFKKPMPLALWCRLWSIVFVDRAEDIEQALVEAFYIAETGRPGPVHVDITKDAFLQKRSILEIFPQSSRL